MKHLWRIELRGSKNEVENIAYMIGNKYDVAKHAIELRSEKDIKEPQYDWVVYDIRRVD